MMMMTYVARRLRKMFICLSIASCLTTFILHFYSLVGAPLAPFYTSRPRLQNSSTYQYTRFRNLPLLTKTCEQMTTIDCLNYLHHNTSYSLQQLSPSALKIFQTQYCTTNKMLFHTFWNDPETLNDPLLLLHIQSYLFTQNRLCSHLIIWTLPTSSGEIDPKYNVHAPSLQFRSLKTFSKDLHEVGIDIEFYGLPSLFNSFFGPAMAALSDAVRFIVLHKLGGIYVDADILLLRDFQPFYAHQFAYRWSTVDEFNTAVLRFNPGSSISSVLIRQAYESQSPSTFFPLSIRSAIHPVTLDRLPAVFFDPLWLVADNADPQASELWKLSRRTKNTFESVFQSRSVLSRRGRSTFNGAFAFHWHALHRAGMFEQDSFLDQWKNFLDSQLLDGA